MRTAKTRPAGLRCAIYTRKSTEDGLEQEFSSLDAQYEACAAYVASQKHEGWKLVATRFDDGGLSGGTLERPALQRLLAEIDAGRIAMVVVYKIDRLTRSLADFARLVERLDAAGASFVSVTQAFNTSTSMGRLTLNMLLSFAQFEREVTAERIRDKVAASKQKGLWMGGILPLGYDAHPDPNRRELVVNEAEARTVAEIFALYDQHGCLRQVELAARARGLASKRHRFRTGNSRGGGPLSRGQIHYLLTNPVYLGRIRHKDIDHPGLHPAIIPPDLWERVQAGLLEARARPRGRRGLAAAPTSSGNRDSAAALLGRIRDETGDLLTPSHTRRHGRRYRYYVSNRLLAGGPDPAGWRLPAEELERSLATLIIDHLDVVAREHRILATPEAGSAERLAARLAALAGRCRAGQPSLALGFLAAATLERGKVHLALDAGRLAAELAVKPEALAAELLHCSADFCRRRRGIETRIVTGSRAVLPDPTLIRMLATARRWSLALRAGDSLAAIAAREGHSESYLRTRLALAFLAPKLQAAILAGTQPIDLSLERMVRQGVPLDWVEQQRLYGGA